MPKKAKEMSALSVKRLKDNGLYFVGGVPGLALQVRSPDARSWILRTTIAGKRRSIGLGSFPTVSLSAARELAHEAVLSIRMGFDPVQDRKAAVAALRAAQERHLTFAGAVEKYMVAKESQFTGKRAHEQFINSLTRYAFPALGKMPVADIDVRDVARSLEPIWIEKAETASRVRSRIEAVLSWATVAGYRAGANPAAWRGNLSEILPKQQKAKKHFPALPLATAPDWYSDLQGREGMGARALQFVALTAARSGEVRGATWEEVENDMWIIPADRMKATREHRVPLSKAAQDLLKSTPRMHGTNLIFPSTRGGMLSDMTLSALMKRQGFQDRSGRPCVPHGLRSTFRDWAAERTEYPRELAEISLAHNVGSEVERAYRRSDMIERRRGLMADWAEFLSGR